MAKIARARQLTAQVEQLADLVGSLLDRVEALEEAATAAAPISPPAEPVHVVDVQLSPIAQVMSEPDRPAKRTPAKKAQQ